MPLALPIWDISSVHRDVRFWLLATFKWCRPVADILLRKTNYSFFEATECSSSIATANFKIQKQKAPFSIIYSPCSSLYSPQLHQTKRCPFAELQPIHLLQDYSWFEDRCGNYQDHPHPRDLLNRHVFWICPEIFIFCTNELPDIFLRESATAMCIVPAMKLIDMSQLDGAVDRKVWVQQE